MNPIFFFLLNMNSGALAQARHATVIWVEPFRPNVWVEPFRATVWAEGPR